MITSGANYPPTPPMPNGSPDIPSAPIEKRNPRRLSSVWLIPFIAIALGAWLVWNHYLSLGPIATIAYETGDGVIAGKTKVRCRSVDVGTVVAVNLTGDLQGVRTTIRMDKDARHLLREDSQFWIVRPRVSGAGVISGLGTIVSGSYIELAPGVSDELSSRFVGLERPPVTPLSVPGLRVTLLANEAESLAAGSPISFKGITVGRIESRDFQGDHGEVKFDAFIEDTYAHLVTSNTRFWNAAGIDLSLSADGFRMRTGSLGSLVAGGVEFGLPEGTDSGAPTSDGTVFRLHQDREKPNNQPINARLTYMLLFKESVRGLRAEAPVEFRGIPVGSVTSISFDHYPQDPDHRVPVLIKIDPDLIADHGHGDDAGTDSISECVQEGLRASLKTGSLLTGQLFVDLDFKPNAEPAEVVQIGEYATLPTASSGLARIEDKLVLVLDKLEALPVEPVLDTTTQVLVSIDAATKEAQETLASLTKASESLEALLNSESTQSVPIEIQNTLASIQKSLEGVGQDSVLYRDLYRTLDELRDSLQSIRQLADGVERKPNSLLFGKGGTKPAKPRAKR